MSDSIGKTVANLIMNDLKGLLKKEKLPIEESPIAPEVVGFLGRQVADGQMLLKEARKKLKKWFYENLEDKPKPMGRAAAMNLTLGWLQDAYNEPCPAIPSLTSTSTEKK